MSTMYLSRLYLLLVLGILLSMKIHAQTLRVPRLINCEETTDTLTFNFSNATIEPFIQNELEISQITDGKVNYILIRDTAMQSGTRIAWVPVSGMVNVKDLSSLTDYADRIDTTKSEIEFYVGPLLNLSFGLSDFTHPGSSYSKKFEDGLIYRKIATCETDGSTLNCELIELITFCEKNVPPYDLWLMITGSQVVFILD